MTGLVPMIDIFKLFAAVAGTFIGFMWLASWIFRSRESGNPPGSSEAGYAAIPLPEPQPDELDEGRRNRAA